MRRDGAHGDLDFVEEVYRSAEKHLCYVSTRRHPVSFQEAMLEKDVGDLSRNYDFIDGCTESGVDRRCEPELPCPDYHHRQISNPDNQLTNHPSLIAEPSSPNLTSAMNPSLKQTAEPDHVALIPHQEVLTKVLSEKEASLKPCGPEVTVMMEEKLWLFWKVEVSAIATFAFGHGVSVVCVEGVYKIVEGHEWLRFRGTDSVVVDGEWIESEGYSS